MTYYRSSVIDPFYHRIYRPCSMPSSSTVESSSAPASTKTENKVAAETTSTTHSSSSSTHSSSSSTSTHSATSETPVSSASSSHSSSSSSSVHATSSTSPKSVPPVSTVTEWSSSYSTFTTTITSTQQTTSTPDVLANPGLSANNALGHSSSNLQPGTIAGIVCGVLLFIAAIIGSILFCMRRSQKRRREKMRELARTRYWTVSSQRQSGGSPRDSMFLSPPISPLRRPVPDMQEMSYVHNEKPANNPYDPTSPITVRFPTTGLGLNPFADPRDSAPPFSNFPLVGRAVVPSEEKPRRPQTPSLAPSTPSIYPATLHADDYFDVGPSPLQQAHYAQSSSGSEEGPKTPADVEQYRSARPMLLHKIQTSGLEYEMDRRYAL
ncbi:hypothetical protein SISSUDRAFT_1034108 [Sistotremastrum suecicum HHB10207 ss-3]|uniref:Uncharacterized protein n=1 Tax=Sistotremastrum suecicum HHB10207 ss-3 TaxID=1314776 RepID=A0A166CF27_9AGAM|nr:hypothetical protein SISSUDRAFT_1034108 [Sistotremastrum suecicum HHB10207 ss-3]